MYKILIVEDDIGIAEGVKNSASFWNIEVTIATNFSDIMKDFEEVKPHMVLLDITLPFHNGFHWCTEIRKVSKVPIIFLSSASDNMNMVMAMTMGADDFVAKPFDGNVLMAKVQALLRRTYDFTENNPVIEHKGVTLNTADGTITYNGEKIDLSKNEYRILLCLMENKCKIVSREKLIEKLWETDCFIDDNTLTVNINRLRKKLEEAGLSDFITTKKGQGYIIE